MTYADSNQLFLQPNKQKVTNGTGLGNKESGPAVLKSRHTANFAHYNGNGVLQHLGRKLCLLSVALIVSEACNNAM
jgi:hypothetical protein